MWFNLSNKGMKNWESRNESSLKVQLTSNTDKKFPATKKTRLKSCHMANDFIRFQRKPITAKNNHIRAKASIKLSSTENNAVKMCSFNYSYSIGCYNKQTSGIG